MIDFETVFCDVDDFCQEFLPDWHRQLLTQGERRRQRASRLTEVRVCRILCQRIIPMQASACQSGNTNDQTNPRHF